MQTILFTKKDLDQALITKELSGSAEIDYIEVLEIKNVNVLPFNFKNKSIIFTSVHGVESFLNNEFILKRGSTLFNENKIYAVGEKSRAALQKNGFDTFIVKKNAQELSEFILNYSKNEQFIHFCGDIALDTLKKNLERRKIYYEKVIVYNTVLKYPVVKEKFDAVVFFSPSGVRSFLKFNTIQGKKIFSIGKTTSEEIIKYSKEEIFTSEESTLEDVLHLVNNKL